MKPTDDDDGDIPDEPQDELIAQIVPLRRRHDDTDRGEQPHDEPQAGADGNGEWSVFDPPEDLQLAERRGREQPRGPGSDHDLPGADLERPWTSMPRLRSRLVAFAGLALTTVAIAALAVLTLKGHAGASPRQPAAHTPNAGLPTTNGSQAAVQQRASAPRHESATATPKHSDQAKRRPSRRARPLSHTTTVGTRSGVGFPSARSSGGSTTTRAPSEPSASSGTSAAGSAAREFGFER